MADVTITLGGVTLDPDLRWVERQQVLNVAQSIRATLGGGVHILANQVEAGIPITLESGQDFGWLKTAQVEAVKALADDAGATLTLEIASGTNVEEYTVVFRHHEPPAFDAVPLIPRIVPDADDYFRATIKLITV